MYICIPVLLLVFKIINNNGCGPLSGVDLLLPPGWLLLPDYWIT